MQTCMVVGGPFSFGPEVPEPEAAPGQPGATEDNRRGTGRDVGWISAFGGSDHFSSLHFTFLESGRVWAALSPGGPPIVCLQAAGCLSSRCGEASPEGSWTPSWTLRLQVCSILFCG